MSFIATRPISVEQQRQREQKQRERDNEQLQLEHDLIIAELLEKISRLEAERNDRN